MKRKEISKIIQKLIPEITWQEREYFSNSELISSLNRETLKEVEKELIEIFKIKKDNNPLIAETLVKLKSKKSVPIFKSILNEKESSFDKIKWARFIFEIDSNEIEMEEIAYHELLNIEFIYEIQGIIFHDLAIFKSERIKKEIEKYKTHKYLLVRLHSEEVIEKLNSL